MIEAAVLDEAAAIFVRLVRPGRIAILPAPRFHRFHWRLI